jgi:branched-chain amino acid transport system substrate-binding protein
VVGSLTGAQAASSKQYGTVAPAWADWVNANGGIGGHPVKVIIEDDQGTPANALSQVETLINSDHVVAIVVGSDNEMGAFEGTAASKGVALVSGAADLPDWLTKVGLFPTSTGVVSLLGAQVAVGKKYGHATKFANLYCAEVPACQLAGPVLQGSAKAQGVGYTALSVSSTAPSYTASCVQLQQQKVDFAQLNFTSSAAVKFVQDCQAQGYNPAWGAAGQAIGPQYLALKNFTAYGPAQGFPTSANAPAVANYISIMEKYAKGSDWRQGTATATWDGLQAVAKALSGMSASSSPTAADVLNGLYGFKNQTLDGLVPNPLNFTKGKPLGLTGNPCYFVTGVQNGKEVAPSNLTPQCPSA